MVSGGMNRNVIRRHHSPAMTCVGDQNDAIEHEPAGHRKDEEQHLAEDQVEGHIGNGIAPEFSFQVVQAGSCKCSS